MSDLVKTKVDLFPRQQVEAILREELMSAVETEASMRGLTLSADPAVAMLTPIPIDSLVAVELVCAAEPVLGFPPHNATVRTGGYGSIKDALDHLIPRLEKQWKKQKGGSK